MRDPARISKVLACIERLWRRNPDLRLCQLIGNALPSIKDPYHVEDLILLQRLHEYEQNLVLPIKGAKTAPQDGS